MRAEMLVQLIVLEYCRCSGIGMKLKMVQFGQAFRKDVANRLEQGAGHQECQQGEEKFK